jgi:aryl-alcohol dehydrogenase-like predicted oxidoreductase
VAFSPLGRAFLTGKLKDVEGLVKGDIRAAMPRFAPEAYAKNLQLLAPMQSIAERAGCTLAELAIAWVLHQGEHVIALPGTTSVDHLREDLRGGAVRLDAALLAELDDLFKPERIQGDRYAVASQREVDTEKYAFEAV